MIYWEFLSKLLEDEERNLDSKQNEISENNLTAVVQSVKSLTPNMARAALEGPRNNEEHRPSRHCTSLESGSL